MDRKEQLAAIAHEFTKGLIAEGKLVEAGFALYRHYVIPKEASALQVEETRLAFMAGAEHIWSSVMTILDPGEEPTADDMARMDKIHTELEGWRAKLAARAYPVKGNA